MIDCTVFSTINMSPQVREMTLFSLPFLMPDHDGLRRADQRRGRADLFKVLAARDVVPLAWGENGFREISNSKRAVRKPDDLKGMKIRFAAGAIFSDIYTALGANPVQMSFADLQPALSTGAVDGQENPINLFLAFKMDTLAQKHLTHLELLRRRRHLPCRQAGVGNVLQAGSGDYHRVGKEAAKRQIAAARKGIGVDGDTSSLEECKKRGVDVATLTLDEKQAFARQHARCSTSGHRRSAPIW